MRAVAAVAEPLVCAETIRMVRNEAFLSSSKICSIAEGGEVTQSVELLR
jgi:hypothetical protein